MVNNAIREFYFPVSLCYDLVCSPVDVPWVHTFQDLTDLDHVCVLSKTSGSHDAGLYLRADEGGWQMILDYESMCSFLAGAVNVRIVVNAVTPQTIPSTAILFRSGFRMPAGSNIEPSQKTVWIVVDSLITGTQLQVVDLQGNLLGNFLVV